MWKFENAVNLIFYSSIDSFYNIFNFYKIKFTASNLRITALILKIYAIHFNIYKIQKKWKTSLFNRTQWETCFFDDSSLHLIRITTSFLIFTTFNVKIYLIHFKIYNISQQKEWNVGGTITFFETRSQTSFWWC
jgi:hypothetical protein